MAVDQSDIEAIRSWAASEPLVRRVWVYGSRVRGTECPDSDIDIAIEHDARPGDSGPLATSLFELNSWHDQLSPKLGVKLHLESYIPGVTTTIQAGLDESSVLIYERPK